jgi:hypothetical protein
VSAAAAEPLKPVLSLEEYFERFVEVAYYLDVHYQDATNPDDDVSQLRLSDWPDETAVLCGIFHVRREALLG